MGLLEFQSPLFLLIFMKLQWILGLLWHLYWGIPLQILTPWQNVMKCLSLITTLCLVWKITPKLLEALNKIDKNWKKNWKKVDFFLKIQSPLFLLIFMKLQWILGLVWHLYWVIHLKFWLLDKMWWNVYLWLLLCASVKNFSKITRSLERNWKKLKKKNKSWKKVDFFLKIVIILGKNRTKSGNISI